MSTTQTAHPFFHRIGNGLRALLAAFIAIAFIGLSFFLAAMVTAAAFAVAGVALLAGAAYWLWRKLSGGSRRRGPMGEGESETVLVARRGPHGWTVEGAERFTS